MTWRQILLAIVFAFPWLYFFFKEVILEPFIQNLKYHKNYTKWNKEHPDLQRIKCKTCKFAKKETSWVGRYPHGTPVRNVVYCSFTRRKINGNHRRCIISEPPSEYFYEIKNKPELYPQKDIKIYYSSYGNCYHSTPYCPSIKHSQHLYHGRMCLTDRFPCPKCWEEKYGVLYPKK